MAASDKILPVGEKTIYTEEDCILLTEVLKNNVLGDARQQYKLRVLAVLRPSSKFPRDFVMGEEFDCEIDLLLHNELVKVSERLTPEEASKMEALAKSGVIQKVRGIAESGEDIWIKRSNGAWQTGKVSLERWWPPFVVTLKWSDSRGEKWEKSVKVEEFLAWQEELHI